jgi:hypothetical protein
MSTLFLSVFVPKGLESDHNRGKFRYGWTLLSSSREFLANEVSLSCLNHPSRFDHDPKDTEY